MCTYYSPVKPDSRAVTPAGHDGPMALASLPDTHADVRAEPVGPAPTTASLTSSPHAGVPDLGLSARMTSLSDSLGDLVADLDPALLVGRDATTLYGDFCRLERLVVAGKTLLAPRIAASGHWENEGHRSPAALLAELEGGSTGQARRTLETGRRLATLPSTEEALRRGALSGAKVAEIAHAAEGDPRAETSLLAGSDSEPLQVVKERCQRVRAASTGRDPLAALAKVHAERSFASWTDSDGAFCFQGRDTAERGARLLARLAPVVDRLRDDRRVAARDTAAARPKGEAAPAPEPESALRADALFLLLTGVRPTPAGPPAHVDPDAPRPGTDGSPLHLSGPDELIGAAPPATVMVRVDLEALRRGRAERGELSEIDGQGPVPVPVVQSLIDDAFVALVFTEAGDIRAVSHRGRTINSHLRTALAFRDRCCVVPGCRVAYGLEIDHVIPMERGGPTELSNLALLCRHHHRLKTYDGWQLARTGPSDQDPGWSFTPLPPFGQEPGLGSQAPRTPPDPLLRN